MPVVFAPLVVQSTRISCLLPDEVTIERAQEAMLLSDMLNGLSRSSFFRQPLLTVLLAPLLPAIMASIFARCSGVSLASTSAGMGGKPLVCPFNVVCHSPGFTSNGRKSAAQSVEQASIVSPIEILLVMGSSFPPIVHSRQELEAWEGSASYKLRKRLNAYVQHGTGVVTTLHSFDGTDGEFPRGGLIQGSDGNLYGTTYQGGTNGAGTIFRLELGLPQPSAYTCTNTTPPVINSIDSAGSYGEFPYFASGSWLEIFGSNLADPNDPRLNNATHSGQWSSSDFNGMNAPTVLDGISASINGKPAYIWFLSPTQMNVQAPEDTATGDIAITVTNCKASSAPHMFSRRALAPGMLAPANAPAGLNIWWPLSFRMGHTS